MPDLTRPGAAGRAHGETTPPSAAARRRRRRDDEVARYRRVLLDRDRAAELTELLARAWPPRSMIELDGWRLRSGPGLPAHAASAWPRSDGGRVPLRVRLDGTHRYYAQAGLTPRVLVSTAAQPRDVEAALAERGWARRGEAEIRTGLLGAVGSLAPGRAVTVALTERLDDRWLDGWAALTGRARRQRDLAGACLAQLETAAYVAAWDDDRMVGAARAVIEGGWVGLPDMAVAGGDADVAAALGRAAADWAADRSVEQVWWLVAAGGGDLGPDTGGAAAAEAVRRAGLRPALPLHLRVAGEAAR